MDCGQHLRAARDATPSKISSVPADLKDTIMDHIIMGSIINVNRLDPTPSFVSWGQLQSDSLWHPNLDVAEYGHFTQCPGKLFGPAGAFEQKVTVRVLSRFVRKYTLRIFFTVHPALQHPGRPSVMLSTQNNQMEKGRCSGSDL